MKAIARKYPGILCNKGKTTSMKYFYGNNQLKCFKFYYQKIVDPK